ALLVEDLQRSATEPMQSLGRYQPDAVFLQQCKQHEPKVRQQWEERCFDDYEAVKELQELQAEIAHEKRVEAAIAGHRTNTWF
ncbi:MAG: hypothetical protein V4719_02460, partial [Planctomycetota bacterium]